jgi:hypothetical protein
MEWIKCSERMPDKGKEVLVWARWDWDGMAGEKCTQPYAALVAVYEDHPWDEEGPARFASVSFNPYSDIAVFPTHWAYFNKPEREELT